MNRLQVSSFLRRFAPLIIALVIGGTFALAHLVIELGVFEFGPLSKNGLLHLLDLKSLDLKFASRPQRDLPEPRVIIAAIDDKAIRKYGLWPWNRTVVADFVRKTTEGGAKVIAFDATFADEDRNSAYVTIKNLVDAFEAKGLTDQGARQQELRRRLEEAEAAHTAALAALADAEKKSKNLPAKRPLVEARKNAERAAAALAATRTAVTELTRAASELHAELARNVATVSPDDALANAIGDSPQTVMGFIGYYEEEELVGISEQEVVDSLAVLAPSAIDHLYEHVIEEIGGQTLDMVRPVEGVDIDKLEVRSLIGALSPLPKIARRTKHFGYFNATPDKDGPVRRIRMVNTYGGRFYPALSLIAAARYLDADIQVFNSEIFPGSRLGGIEVGERYIPTDDHGRLLVNYYSTLRDYFPAHSVADFIDGTLSPEVYKDKIVLFGMTAMGVKEDLRATPLDSNIPGVFIHASAIQSILDGRFLQRFYGIALIEAFLYLLLAVALGLALPRLPIWGGVIATVVFAVGLYFIDTWFVFSQGIWIMNVLPVLQVTVTFIGVAVYGYLTEGKEKRKIRKAFQFYLTKSVVDVMLKEPDKLKLGGERKTCTVLFSDIRGFTTISERLQPEELVNLLNSYLTPMTNLVFKYDGTLDKYMGDAIMAIFGAPVGYPDHATRACYAALEMMAELKILQAGWRDKGLPEIDIGIGLNTGAMAVGNMGSEIRFDYTVMGDNVNLGSRLEGINKEYGTNIIVSEFTYEAAKNDVVVREMDAVRVKGKREPVRIFELLAKGKPTTELRELVTTFEQAIGLYKQQKWDEAIGLFDKVRGTLKPNDYASSMYIKRCETMRANPPGPDWDGVFTMKTK